MLTRWEPFGSIRRRGDLFSELNGIQQEMNRLFDEFFGERRSGLAEGAWVPAVDVSENDSPQPCGLRESDFFSKNHRFGKKS